MHSLGLIDDLAHLCDRLIRFRDRKGRIDVVESFAHTDPVWDLMFLQDLGKLHDVGIEELMGTDK